VFKATISKNKNKARQLPAKNAKTPIQNQRHCKKEGNVLCLPCRMQEIFGSIEKHIRLLLLLQNFQIINILHIPKGVLQVFLP